jgi:hypothetical protein
MRSFVLAVVLAGSSGPAVAQDLPVYGDALQNASRLLLRRGTDFANAAAGARGHASIAFTGNSKFGGNAVSFAHPGGTFASGGYFGCASSSTAVQAAGSRSR